MLSDSSNSQTSNIDEIRTAIDKISIDDSGKENLCTTISAIVDKYGKMARGQKQKLAIVVVTDESGDDGRMVEQALDKARRADASIYILGRESVFGYPFARIRWRDPKYLFSSTDFLKSKFSPCSKRTVHPLLSLPCSSISCCCSRFG